MIDFASLILIFAAFWSLLLQQKFTPGIICGNLPEDEPVLRKFARIGVAFLIILPAIILKICLG